MGHRTNWATQVKSVGNSRCVCVREKMTYCLCVYSWLSALESTKWLQHLSLLLKAALLVVHAVDRDHRPVLVHCSDGWDRTPQIVALSKLLLDPYYRTIEVQIKTLRLLDFGLVRTTVLKSDVCPIRIVSGLIKTGFRKVRFHAT